MATAHIAGMIDRSQWKRLLTHPVVDWSIFIIGVILILLSPVVGALPGPGGIFVLALGLAMVLRTSRWARRRYVEFKKWQPKAGRWTDWGLRRKSALRREKIAKDQSAGATLPVAEQIEVAPVALELPGADAPFPPESAKPRSQGSSGN